MTQYSKNLMVHLKWNDPVTADVRELDAPPPISIGRVGLNTIAIDSDDVSRYHARIEIHSGQLFIIDQGSTNGTVLNSKAELRAILNDGDRFRVGPVMFAVALREASAEEITDQESRKLSGLGELNKTVMMPSTKKGLLNPQDESEDN